MTIPIPLTVRLKTRRKDMDVTNQLVDLRFRSSIPGGFATCTFTLNRPLDIQPDEIEYYGTVYIYDGRNSRVIWEGRLEDPGRSAGDRGETWSLSATGPRAHAMDQTFPVIYIDQSLERWTRSKYSVSKAVTETAEIDETYPALVIRANEGDAIDTAWVGDWIYRYLAYSGQKLARIRADVVGDGGSANYPIGIFTRIGGGSSGFNVKQSSVAGNSVIAANTSSSGWDNDANVASLRFQRDTSSTTAGDTTAQYFYNVFVRALLKKVDGTDDFTNTYSVNNVDPIEVVADLLGRVLTKFDGPGATLVGSGIDIDQLAYPDGTTADAILADLATFDPGYYWAAWESNTAGKNRFEYVPWPSVIRYEADTVDGYDAPASGGELYNRVHVRWRDAIGRVRNTVRSQTVTELSDASLIRTAYLDIADEIGSATNADYVGDNFLIEHKYPPNAGTLRIARPILDNVESRMVMPWEILPGNLIRVQGILPRVDALNATARDGVTIFRVISTEFSSSDGAVTLELDSYARTIARYVSPITDLVKRKFRKR
jgi:hypothetical protein